MNVVFAGTPEFAAVSLRALHACPEHRILAVYTQPDRPAGRGRRLTPSPVKQYALAHGLALHQPENLREEAPRLRALAPDVMVVVAYGSLLPPAVLAVPRYGCVNVHASLLPRWRGAAPIPRALEAGDPETGISIMQMDAGLDTGPVLLQAREPIHDTDTSATLEARLAMLGAETLLRALAQLARGTAVPQAQDSARATYAPKLSKREAPLDWRQPAERLHRKVRALNPWPVATTTWNGETLRIWEVGPLGAGEDAPSAAPGTVTAAGPDGIDVQTGRGRLRLLRLQPAGARILSARELVNGRRLRAGERFGT
jgi:methionyl-tRNA formyltransferase